MSPWDPRLVALVRAVGHAAIVAAIAWITAAAQDESYRAVAFKYAWVIPLVLAGLRWAEGWLDKWKGQAPQKPFGGGPAV